jgi:hypothetical protein
MGINRPQKTRSWVDRGAPSPLVEASETAANPVDSTAGHYGAAANCRHASKWEVSGGAPGRN